MYQSHTGHLTGLWFLLKLALWLNTNYYYILFTRTIIIGGILILHICIYIYIYTYITRLASNEIFSPSNKIQREVGRAKDLSASRYIQCLIYLESHGFAFSGCISSSHVTWQEEQGHRIGHQFRQTCAPWPSLLGRNEIFLYARRRQEILTVCSIRSPAFYMERQRWVNSLRGVQKTNWGTCGLYTLQNDVFPSRSK